jgi:hypothetical protein
MQDKIDSESLAIMRYLLTCSCGKSIPVSKGQAGSTVACSACNTIQNVPTIRQLTKLPIEAAAETAKSTWSRPVGLFAGACFLIMCYSGLYGTLFALDQWDFRSTNPELASWTLDKELAAGDDMVNQFTPAELWFVWGEYQQMGVINKNPPENYGVKLEYDLRYDKMRNYWIVFGVALLGFILAIVFGRKRKAS